MGVERMLKLLVVVFFVLVVAIAAWPQNAQAPIEPKSENPAAAPPEIHFTLTFPQATPPFFTVAIEATGRAEYKSTPDLKNEGDPYTIEFTASEATRTRLFELARQLNFFQGNYDYNKKVAFTGTKTLTFKNGTEQHQTTYNWSQSPQIQEITTTFLNISNTIEMGRQLRDKYRYDKLGVDAILASMETEAKDNRLAELQIIEPTLSRMAKDTSLMNISRRRAEFLLSKVPPGTATASTGQPQP